MTARRARSDGRKETCPTGGAVVIRVDISMDPNVPGQVYGARSTNPRARTPPENDPYWRQNYSKPYVGSGGGGSRSRHRRYMEDDSFSGSGDDDDFDLRSAEAAEVARLREELRAARRRLDAGERRERSLRRSSSHMWADRILQISVQKCGSSDFGLPWRLNRAQRG